MALDHHSCSLLLKSCRTNLSIQGTQQLHLLLIKAGLDLSLFFGNSLIQMYTKCDDIIDAQCMFDTMPQRNYFSSNTLIEAYLKQGDCQNALVLFNSMPDKNCFSWDLVISGCAKRGNLDIAERLFKEMPVKNATTWNSMIHGYARHGMYREALRLFKNLNLDPFESSHVDNFVLASVVGACASLGILDYGRQVHAYIFVNKIELDSVLGSSLINMYGKCGDPDCASRVLGLIPEPDEFSLSALITGYSNYGRLIEARRIFDIQNNPTVVLVNSMIAGYVANNRGEDAVKLFNMIRLEGFLGDQSTFGSVLSACLCFGTTEIVQQMHAYGHKFGILTDVIVGSVLVDIYFKSGNAKEACKFFGEVRKPDTVLFNSMISIYFSCGRIRDARLVFERMAFRSLISWNSMIVGYSQNGCPIEALELFIEMHRLGLKMDKVTLASAIGTCATICHLKLGEQIIARATIVGLTSDQIISTSLIDLYCKSGNVKDGRRVFDEMKRIDEVSWNCMLMGYATNGYGIETLKLFEEMRACHVSLNDITFIAVLSSCDHCGLVEEGWKWFCGMKNIYGIEPKADHYSCMIDILTREGQMEEALDFIEKMPFEADVSMWSSLLRGFNTVGDVSRGKKVAERIIELDPNNVGAYVQLSNIYASCGEWEKSTLVREKIEERRIRKNPGCSWIDD